MRFKRLLSKAAVALLTVAFALTTAHIPAAQAMDRIQWLVGMNPPSPWLNQNERDTRIGFGQLIYDATGTTNGFFHNLTTIPAGGLNISIGPTSVNTVGSLYQYLPEEATAFGGFPSGVGGLALPVDPTQVFLQGTLLTQTANVGPLTGPSTSGQTIDYIAECQVSTQDISSQGITLVSSSGVASNATANETRTDTIVCQSKAGTAATTGTQVPPATDAGWVCVSVIAVANGTSTITTGMISGAQQMTGFVQLTPSSVQSGSIALSGPVQIGTGYAPQTLSNTGAITSTNPRIVYAHGLTATTTGSCTNLTVCSLSAGGTVAFTNGSVLTDAPACYATVTGSSALHVLPFNAATSGISISVLNQSGGTVATATTVTYDLGCIGD